ncbi:MAG: hypothetical protein WB502_05350 [Thermoactinomyces sp.]
MKKEQKKHPDSAKVGKSPITNTDTEFSSEIFEDDSVNQVTKAIQESYSQIGPEDTHIDK